MRASILAFILAGCMSASEDAPLPMAPTEWTMEDCYEVAGTFPMPSSQAATYLPDGFAPAPYSAAGSAPGEPAEATAELLAIASRCHADEVPFERAFTAIFVSPPEELRNPEAAFGHLFLLGYWTNSSAHAEVWDAWGLNATVTDIDLAVAETAVHRTGTATPAFTIDTTVLGPSQEMAANKARFFQGTAVADAEFGALTVMLGTAVLSGPADVGIWTEPMAGPAFHAWGHSNHWKSA